MLPPGSCYLLTKALTVKVLMTSVLHGLANILTQSALNNQAERLKSSAARPVDKLEAVVLNGLLADRD